MMELLISLAITIAILAPAFLLGFMYGCKRTNERWASCAYDDKAIRFGEERYKVLTLDVFHRNYKEPQWGDYV